MYRTTEDMLAGVMTPRWTEYFSQLANHQESTASVSFDIINGSFTDDSPSSGYIEWDRIWIKYSGKTHRIKNGSTDSEWLYWQSTSPREIKSSSSYPTPSDTLKLIGRNDSGTLTKLWKINTNGIEEIADRRATLSRITDPNGHTIVYFYSTAFGPPYVDYVSIVLRTDPKFTVNQNNIQVYEPMIFNENYCEYTETSPPSTPNEDKLRIFAQDNGAGVTQLAVIFPSGNVKIISEDT